MKKAVSVLLAAVLVFCCAAPALSAVVPARYLVTAASARVYKAPDSESSVIFEVAGGTYLKAIKEENGFLLVDIPSQGMTGWVFAADMTYSPVANETEIKEIYVFRKPDKIEYTETEETFDPSGLIVKARKYDGTETVINGYSIYAESFLSTGVKKITVLFRLSGSSVVFTASFTVNVNRIPLTGLTVARKPAKTEYVENLPLDLSGITLVAKYSDGRSDDTFHATDILRNKSFTVTVDGSTDTSKLTPGKHTVKIVYRYPDIFCTFDITVRKKTLTGFYVEKEPDNMTVYSLDTVPSLAGIQLRVVYDNGESYVVTDAACTVTCDLSTFKYGTGNYVTLTYFEKSVTLNFTVRPLEEKRLKLTLPQVLTFIVGEEIDLSGLKVEVEYTDGSVKEITDYTLGSYDPLLTEQGQQITVKHGAFTELFAIYITDRFQRGDVDGNGKVSVADARFALRQAVGLIELAPNSKNYAAADVDRDGVVTVRDARLILRGAVGLEKLPLALYVK